MESRGAVSIVVVLFNTRTLNILSIAGGGNAELILVHNDSTFDVDSLGSGFGGYSVKNIYNTENIGFGAACNAGAQIASGEVLVFLNPDVEIDSQGLEFLVQVGGDQIRTLSQRDGNGVDQVCVSRYPSVPGLLLMFLRLRKILRIPRRPQPRTGDFALTEYWASGSIFSIHRSNFLDVGGFSKEFFLYYEDVDLCKRLSLKGTVRRIVMGSSEARHSAGGSIDNSNRANVAKIRRRAALTYARIHLLGSKHHV